MSEYVETGEELERLIKLGRKHPMPFAFCPSVGEDDALFATHRKKPPEVIARSARKASGQTKVAFGTFTVEQKTIILTLLKELPNIGKKLKKYLRRERLSLSIRILDISGNLLEWLDHEDEDGPPDPVMARFDEDPEDDADPDDDPPDPEAEAADLPDPTEVAQLLKALQPRLAVVPGPAGEKLRAVLGGAAALVRAGAVEKAAIYAEAVAAVLDRMDPPGPVVAPPAPAPAAAAPGPTVPTNPAPEGAVLPVPLPGHPDPGVDAADPQVQVLAQDLRALKARAETLPPQAREKVLAAVSHAAQQLRGGDVAGAAQTAATLQRALGPERDTPPPADPKWAAAEGLLRPAVEAALAGGQGDGAALATGFARIEALAAQGRVEEALAGVPALVALIRAARPAAPTEAAIKEAGLRRTLKRWDATRITLNDEMARLKSAIDATLAGIDGMDLAAAATDRLFAYLDRLDARLDDALDDLEAAADGPRRDRLRDRARALVAEYRSELDSDFFRDVDDANGFVPVKVRKTALAALGQISAALD